MLFKRVAIPDFASLTISCVVDYFIYKRSWVEYYNTLRHLNNALQTKYELGYK